MGMAGVWNIPVEEGGLVRARFVVIAAGRRIRTAGISGFRAARARIHQARYARA